MSIRLNGSTSGYIEIDAPAVANNQTYVVPQDFGFAAGTSLLFQQTTAPTGWTKSTTHNDKALRVVSGAVGSGGATAFSAVMNGSVGATTLTTTQIPSHSHQVSQFSGYLTDGNTGFSGQWVTWGNNNETLGGALFSFNAGGGGSHTHSMNVAYVDVIIAVKN